MARQSKQDRLRRLNEGRCPVHGIWMPQVGNPETYQGIERVLVGCPRRDCAILAYAQDVDGPRQIHPDFEAVISEAPEDNR